jgi:hypothetical protein
VGAEDATIVDPASVHLWVPSDHLSAEELAAYLDGVVTPADRRRIEAHLVRCDPCLSEVIAMLRILRDSLPPNAG